MLLLSALLRFLVWTALVSSILTSWPAHAQLQGSDVFSSSGKREYGSACSA